MLLSGKEATSSGEEDDKYLYVVLMCAGGEYSHSLHKISVADLKSRSRRRRHGGDRKAQKTTYPSLF